MEHQQYMRRCLQLARRGAGYVAPNPMVGAVVVCDGRIIGEGYHRHFGGPHAEPNAIRAVADPDLLHRSTLYVSLEPCAMCATAISLARIRNIYFAAADEKGGALQHNARIYETDKHLWRPNVMQMPEFADASAHLLREFFRARRNTKK